MRRIFRSVARLLAATGLLLAFLCPILSLAQTSMTMLPPIRVRRHSATPTPTPKPTATATPTPSASPTARPTLSPTPSPTATPIARTPIKADYFLSTLGATTHHTQGRDTAAQVQSGIQYLGVRHIRDDGTTNSTLLNDYCNIHTATGMTMSMLPWGGDLPDTQGFLDTLAKCGALLDIEGPNEPNNQPFVYNGNQCSESTSFLPCAQFQAALYAASKADPNLKNLPVFASTEPGAEPDNAGLQFLRIPAGAGTLMADGTVLADYANLHNYVKCNGCAGLRDNIAWNAEAPGQAEAGGYDGMDGDFVGATWGRHFPAAPYSAGPSMPRVTTETGWDTASLSQDQQGKVLTNVYLSAAARGWSYTFIYQMIDDSDSFGLFKNTSPLTPKLAATYIHNLTTILADTTSNFSATPLGYTISNQSPTVHDLLLQKSDGTYALAVWGDQVVGESIDVTVNLPSITTVSIYDVTIGTSPVVVYTGVSSIPLTMTDHAMILEFK
jgi:hypothetical protein